MTSMSGNEAGLADCTRPEDPEHGLFFELGFQGEVEHAGLPPSSRQPSQEPVIEFHIVDDSDEGGDDDDDDDEWTSDSDATLSDSGEPEGYWLNLNQYGGWYFNIFTWRYEPKYWFAQPDPRTSCNQAAALLNEPVSLLTKYRHQRLGYKSKYFESSIPSPSNVLCKARQVRRGSHLKKVRNVHDQGLRWA